MQVGCWAAFLLALFDAVPGPAQEIDFAKWSNAMPRGRAEQKPSLPARAKKIADVARQEEGYLQGT
jgi:hypothetical protein